MAKKTLLKIVQNILSEMDSDSVNSINDTVEAMQVADIVKSCYEEIVSNRNWPHTKKLMQLDSGTLARPNYMKIPEDVKEVVTLAYDVKKDGETRIQYKEIKYLYPDEFLNKLNERNSDEANVTTVSDSSGVKLQIYNDKAPQYWTSFDDEYIVFDAYNSAIDDTLKQSKSQVTAYVEPTWEHTDEFIPDLPTDAFSLLEEESKSTAFFVLKQMVNQKAEQKAGRQQRWLSRKAWKAKGGVRYEDYGRKSRK